jgi:hypothetical protein
MANSLVVRKGTDLAKRIKALRAAQYVRMSTDFQRYSIQNQAATIAADDFAAFAVGDMDRPNGSVQI